MATTRLMPLHTGKGRTVGQAISAIIDYTENPQKTDGGRLITSWQCGVVPCKCSRKIPKNLLN